MVEPLTFSPNLEVTLCSQIPIQNDSVLEDDETFSVLLSTSDSSVSLVPSSGLVTIVDDDSK